PLSPPLGPCPRLIHLGQTRREADRRDEGFSAKAYGTRPTRTLAGFLLRNNNNAGRGIALLSNVHGADQYTEQQTSTLSCRFISISRCARTAPVQLQDEQKNEGDALMTLPLGLANHTSVIPGRGACWWIRVSTPPAD